MFSKFRIYELIIHIFESKRNK